MPKEFYTEKDIEDMVKRGIMSLDMNENVVLTELAYEKANRLGLKLLQKKADTPPAAPIRPYLSEKVTASSAVPAPVKAQSAAAVPQGDLGSRIRSAVIAKMGAQVDPALLDSIIQRVLKSTGAK